MRSRYFIICALILISQKSFHKQIHSSPIISEEIKKTVANHQIYPDISESKERTASHGKDTMGGEASVKSIKEDGESSDDSKKIDIESIDETALAEEEFLNSLEEDGNGIYNLYINGKGVSKTYPVYRKGERRYLSLYDFIDLVGIRDYVKKNGVLTVKIGVDGLEREIDLNTMSVEKRDKSGKTISKKGYGDEIFKKHGVVYIGSEIFENIFDSGIKISEKNLSVNITTKFETPEDIEVILKNRFNIGNERKDSVEILYESERELFSLGNARINLRQNFSQNGKGAKKESDWDGNLEYSGELLYGNFTTSYTPKTSEIGSADLYYKDLWRGHSLTLGSYPTGNSREKGLMFKKERSYQTDGREVMISERVPIGSIVELIYQGTAIDIQSAEDGYVEFRNVGIQMDRNYTLKIYTPTGEIRTKEIQTSVTYHQQNRGGMEYSVNWREDKNSGEYRGHGDFYYGVTDKLTLSSGFSRNPIQLPDDKKDDGDGNREKPRYRFDDRLRGEAIYTDYLYTFPYTVSLNGERSLSRYEQGEKKLEELYTIGGLATINIKELKLEVEDKYHGKYFNEKRGTNYNARYSLFGNSLELTSNFEIIEKYDGEKERHHDYGINVAKSFGNYSLMGDYSRTSEKKSIYRGDFYFNGFDRISLRFSGEYERGIDSEKDKYEMKVAVRNKGWNSKFDFSVEARYRNSGESAIGLSFSMKIDDWFVMDGSTDKFGNSRVGVGVDKVISLKNPTEKISDINSSRVKVRTFLDSNRNNRYDDGEAIIPQMKVKIGEREIFSDDNGEGYIHGLSRGISYEIKATLNRPEHHLAYTAMKVLPKSVSEIEVDIPVQPFVTLEGYISLDGLELEDEKAIEIYNNIVVTVMDENGRELEHTIPEDDGMFQVSGLFSEKYKIKIQYLGNDQGVEEHIETIELAYGIPDRNRYVFTLKDRYSIVRKGERVE